MINQIQVRLPYPIRVGFFSLNRKIKLWFSFDNLSLFLFQQSEKIENSNDFKAWQESHGKYDLFVYGAYYAAKSYALQNRLKFNVDLKKFAVGLSGLSEKEMEQLTKTWQTSQSYGHADLPGKKKAKAK